MDQSEMKEFNLFAERVHKYINSMPSGQWITVRAIPNMTQPERFIEVLKMDMEAGMLPGLNFNADFTAIHKFTV